VQRLYEAIVLIASFLFVVITVSASLFIIVSVLLDIFIDIDIEATIRATAVLFLALFGLNRAAKDLAVLSKSGGM